MSNQGIITLELKHVILLSQMGNDLNLSQMKPFPECKKTLFHFVQIEKQPQLRQIL